jgi:hypothetical protein
MKNRFSAIKFTKSTDLDAIKYSKFKFGDKDAAREFGNELADSFIRNLFQPILSKQGIKQIVVCSSPYCFIPTATFALKDYFVNVLNEFLMDEGWPVIEETKIHRTITYREDYGELNAEERMKLISNDMFHIDEVFIKNKTILFLDDIRITGSHERVIQRMCQQYKLENEHYFGYYAELVDPNIDPRIENQLNYAYVKSLLHLDKVIKNSDFMFNTRIVKYILNSDPDEFDQFIRYQPIKLVKTIYHLAIGNSYHLIENYKRNFNFIKFILNEDL